MEVYKQNQSNTFFRAKNILYVICLSFVIWIFIFSLQLVNRKKYSLQSSSAVNIPSQIDSGKSPAYTDNGIFPEISLSPMITEKHIATVATSPKQIQKTIARKLIPALGTPTPIASTGAILIAPSSLEINTYTQLFSLLSSDGVYSDTFSIVPDPKNKQVLISVNAPISVHKQDAINWLQQNGFALVPDKYLFFVER